MSASSSPYPLLERIVIPADLRKVPEAQLEQVCKELRDFIIDVVSVKGGHFGASLGVVELTVALHYVFNTPYDQLVWDVGHQAYGHKILTGRRADFHTNRIYKGLSGFPKRSESPYDTFGVGHSSTSVGQYYIRSTRRQFYCVSANFGGVGSGPPHVDAQVASNCPARLTKRLQERAEPRQIFRIICGCGK